MVVGAELSADQTATASSWCLTRRGNLLHLMLYLSGGGNILVSPPPPGERRGQGDNFLGLGIWIKTLGFGFEPVSLDLNPWVWI